VGFQSLMTTTHPTNVNLPSSGQQVTARLSPRKVSVTGGEQGPRPPGQGHYNLHTATASSMSVTIRVYIEGWGVKFQSVVRTDLLHSVLKFLLKSRWETWPQIKNRDHKNLRRSNRWSLQKKIMQRTD